MNDFDYDSLPEEVWQEAASRLSSRGSTDYSAVLDRHFPEMQVIAELIWEHKTPEERAALTVDPMLQEDRECAALAVAKMGLGIPFQIGIREGRDDNKSIVVSARISRERTEARLREKYGLVVCEAVDRLRGSSPVPRDVISEALK